MKQVDEYIATLQAEVESYKEKDAAINDAIVSAQQAANDIVLNAKNQGRAIKENTAKQLADIALSAATQRQMLNDFATEYEALATKYLKATSAADFKAVLNKIDGLEKYLANFSDEISEDLALGKKKGS